MPGRVPASSGRPAFSSGGRRTPCQKQAGGPAVPHGPPPSPVSAPPYVTRPARTRPPGKRRRIGRERPGVWRSGYPRSPPYRRFPGSSTREAIRGQPSLATTSMLGNVPAHGDQDARRRLLWHPPSSRSAGTLQSIPPDTAGLPERPMTRRGPIAAAGAPPGALLSAFTGRPYEGNSLRFNKLSSLLPLYVRIVLDRRLPPWASYPQ